MKKLLSLFLYILFMINCSSDYSLGYNENSENECNVELLSVFFQTIPCNSILLMPTLCKHKVKVYGKYIPSKLESDNCYVSGYSYIIEKRHLDEFEKEKLINLGWYKSHSLDNKLVFYYKLNTSRDKPKAYIKGKNPEFLIQHELPINNPWLTAIELKIEDVKDLSFIGYSK